MQLFAEFIVVISPALSSETVNERASCFGGYQNRVLAKKNFIPGTYDFLYTITIIHTSFQFLEFITLFSIFYTFQTLLLCFLTVYLSNKTTFFKLLGRFSEGQIMFQFDIFLIIQTRSIFFVFWFSKYGFTCHLSTGSREVVRGYPGILGYPNISGFIL